MLKRLGSHFGLVPEAPVLESGQAASTPNAKHLRLLASFLANGYSIMIMVQHLTPVFSTTPSPIGRDVDAMNGPLDERLG